MCGFDADKHPCFGGQKKVHLFRGSRLGVGMGEDAGS